MPGLAEVAVGLGRALRASGLDAPVSSVTCFAEALETIGLARPEEVFWAGHASFVRRPEETATYAAAFAAFFTQAPRGRFATAPSPAVSLATDDEDGAAREAEEAGREAQEGLRILRYSRSEVLREKDFSACTDDEIAELHKMMASMRQHPSRRASRRQVPARSSRGSLDMRGSVRRAMRSGGEPITLSHLAKAERDRPVVLLVDVSGSMAPYARAFLHFAHAAVAQGRRVEAFALGTRLTRITRELAWRDPDAAILRAARSVSDIAGGTRLGEGLATFNDRFGVAGMARGAVVVILSDGWDRGDPDRIASEMERLRRVAHRVIWVNPLKATPGYEPLARGMAAALPYLDAFLEGHSLRSLERLVGAMAG